MSQQNATQKKVTVTVGLAANLPDPRSIEEGVFFYAQDTGALWVNTILPGGAHIWGEAFGTVVNAPVAFWVDPLLGKNTNPGTQALPFATLQYALAQATLFRSTVSTTINLKTGAYNLGANPMLVVPTPLPGALPLMVIGQTVDSGSGTITVTGGSASAFVPPALGTATGTFVNHAFKKMFVTWLAGSANAGKRNVVTDNSTTTISMTGTLTLPVNNDTCTIGSPGAILTWTGALTWMGSVLLQDMIQYTIPTGANQLQFLNGYTQDNAVVYQAASAASFCSIGVSPTYKGGQNKFPGLTPYGICGNIYDGSLMGSSRLFFFAGGIDGSTNGNAANSIWDSCAIEVTQCSSLIVGGVHSATNCEFASQFSSFLELASGIYTNLVANPDTGIGLGCIAAKSQSMLFAANLNITGSPAAAPIFSLDQSKGTLNNIAGTNGSSTKVLILHKASSCEVSGITATDSSAGSTATVGGTATVTISGAVAQTTDIAAGTPELCVVGAPQ